MDGAADVGALGRRAMSASALTPAMGQMAQSALNNRMQQTALHDKSIQAQVALANSFRQDQAQENQQNQFYSQLGRALGNDAYGRQSDQRDFGANQQRDQRNFIYNQDRDNRNDFRDDRDFTRTLARDQQDIYRDERNFGYDVQQDQNRNKVEGLRSALEGGRYGYAPSQVAGLLGPAGGNIDASGLDAQFKENQASQNQMAMQKQAAALSGTDTDAFLHWKAGGDQKQMDKFYNTDGTVTPAGMAEYQVMDMMRRTGQGSGWDPAAVAKEALANPEAARAKVDSQGRMNRDPMWFLGGQAQTQPAPMQNQQAPVQQAQQAPSSMAQTQDPAQQYQSTPNGPMYRNQGVLPAMATALGWTGRAVDHNKVVNDAWNRSHGVDPAAKQQRTRMTAEDVKMTPGDAQISDEQAAQRFMAEIPNLSQTDLARLMQYYQQGYPVSGIIQKAMQAQGR